MISVAAAEQIILAQADFLGAETAPLDAAHGRVLQAPLIADRDFPPFTRVSMDGIAIAYSAYAGGRRTFPIAGVQAAGAAPLHLNHPGACLEVMTGAVLPTGADTVIRYEDLSIQNGEATIVVEQVRAGQNAHPQGLDRRAGDRLATPGVVLSPGEIGLAATVGQAVLEVARAPRIAVIYTGDELVGVADQPLPHQIRASNGYALRSVLARFGCEVKMHHLPDAPDIIRAQLAAMLDRYDALILSGGVSKGKYDFIPESLQELGVEQLFYKVRQRPGKPFWFGRQPSGPSVFALPGNPVSALMCALRYCVPWVRKAMGLEPFDPLYAVLEEDFSLKPDLTCFLAVSVKSDPLTGQLQAFPVPGRGSGDLANLALTDGFMELPAGTGFYEKGGVYPVYLYR